MDSNLKIGTISASGLFVGAEEVMGGIKNDFDTSGNFDYAIVILVNQTDQDLDFNDGKNDFVLKAGQVKTIKELFGGYRLYLDKGNAHCYISESYETSNGHNLSVNESATFFAQDTILDVSSNMANSGYIGIVYFA